MSKYVVIIPAYRDYNGDSYKTYDTKAAAIEVAKARARDCSVPVHVAEVQEGFIQAVDQVDEAA